MNIDAMPAGREILPLGTMVPYYGIIIAVGHVGERYYWMDYGGVISMVPADLIERAALKSVEAT